MDMDANIMQVVKYEVAKCETHCHTCGCSLKYVITLSDGNTYGMNCANKILGRKNYTQAYFPKVVYKFQIISELPFVMNRTHGVVYGKTESAAIKLLHKVINEYVCYRDYRGKETKATYIGTKREITVDKFKLKLIEE